MLKKLLITASLAVLSTSAYADDDSSVVFSGMSFTKDSNYFYAGGVTAPFGSINEDGVLLRAVASRGAYDYNKSVGVTGEGDSRSIDAEIGYQFLNAGIFSRLTAYVGVEHQNHELTPADPLNEVQGYETGVKGILETVVKLDDSINLNVSASYSGAFDSYWSRTQLAFGCDCGGAKFGPEFSALGNEAFDAQRYGAFIDNIPLGDKVKGNISAGFSSESSRGEDGLYAQIGFSFLF